VLALTIVAILGFSALAIIPSDYVERATSIYTMEEKEGNSIGARLEILEDSWHVFTEYPMGVGPAAFPLVRARLFGRSQDTHNLYLEIATNLGALGLLVFLGFVVSMLAALRRVRNTGLRIMSESDVAESARGKSEDANRQAKIIVALSNATMTFVLVRLAVGMFGMDLYEIYWWFALGLTVVLTRMTETLSDSTRNH
jgi:O-antigen ligase